MSRFGTIIVTVALSGCISAQAPTTPSLSTRDPASKYSHGFKVLHAFTGGKDGRDPLGDLIGGDSGVLGTTFSGGDFTNCSDGCGTVFGRVDYRFGRFAKSSDGAHPKGAILNGPGGDVWGTTAAGGTGCNDGPYGPGCGTVYAINLSSGREKVVYRFKGGADGEDPEGGLTSDHGSDMFGSTKYGGDASCGGGLGCGTIFDVTSNGKEHVLYAFKGGSDGAYPESVLIYGSALYGTTSAGGTGCGSAGCGTVFSVTPTGYEQIVYRFKGGSDGANPVSGLTGFAGQLFGVTRFGGNQSCGVSGQGCGTLYRLTGYRNVYVLYRFDGPDGAQPIADMAVAPETRALYGTTAYGGAHNAGVIFQFVSKKPRVIFSFAGGAGGANPASTLVATYAQSPLYGTTMAGGTGCGSSGCGTYYQVNQ